MYRYLIDGRQISSNAEGPFALYASSPEEAHRLAVEAGIAVTGVRLAEGEAGRDPEGPPRQDDSPPRPGDALGGARTNPKEAPPSTSQGRRRGWQKWVLLLVVGGAVGGLGLYADRRET